MVLVFCFIAVRPWPADAQSCILRHLPVHSESLMLISRRKCSEPLDLFAMIPNESDNQMMELDSLHV